MRVMRLQINPQSSVPLYAQIVDQIRNQIISGTLPSGFPLPSVREISEQIEVNSLTIQKALKILESDQLIVIRRGVGAFVSSHVSVMSMEQKEILIKKSLASVIFHAQELGVLKERLHMIVDECWGDRT
jgi:GntR family transcriptional regulator